MLARRTKLKYLSDMFCQCAFKEINDSRYENEKRVEINIFRCIMEVTFTKECCQSSCKIINMQIGIHTAC